MLMKNVLRSTVPARGSYKLEMQVGYATASSVREEDTQDVKRLFCCARGSTLQCFAFDPSVTWRASCIRHRTFGRKRYFTSTERNMATEVIWEPNPGKVSGAR